MNTRISRTALLALALATPAAVHAQRGGGPRAGAGANPIAPLIDMRRELNLSARQLTQLDSIERSLLQRNQGLRTGLRSRADSLPRRRRDLTDAEIQSARAFADSARSVRGRIVRNDSIARAAAMAVLTDSQRVRVRERIAERRGFAAGRASAQRGVRRGAIGQGFGGGRMQPGGRRGMQGMGARGMRPGGRMGGPDGMGPQGGVRGRRPPVDGFGPMDGPRGGMRRMGPDGGFPPDGDVMPRRRRMAETDSLPPEARRPLRRPPPDSGR